MSPRSIRRAAERKAEKLARKAERSSMGTGCTGPRTPEGKAISCLNATKHGLTGNFKVMEFESQEAFDELRNALRAEHRPATPTEIVLVDRIAEHIWLSQRAQKFSDAAFLDHDEKMMALMLRYRTTHDRAFHKCLAELRVLRKERREEQEQFESQNVEIQENSAAAPDQSQKQSDGRPAQKHASEFESQENQPVRIAKHQEAA